MMKWDCDTNLDIKGGVETHTKMTLSIFVKHAMEARLEYGSSERIGDDHDTVGVVGERLHLQQTYLVETPSKYIDSVPILS